MAKENSPRGRKPRGGNLHGMAGVVLGACHLHSHLYPDDHYGNYYQPYLADVETEADRDKI